MNISDPVEFVIPPVPPLQGGEPDPKWANARGIKTYSPSMVRTAIECTARWMFQYKHHLPFITTPQIQIGSWIDNALSRFNANWMERGEPGTADDVAEAAEQSFAEYANHLPMAAWTDEEIDPAVAKKRGVAALRLYVEKGARLFPPKAIQKDVWIPAGVLGSKAMKGRIDLLTTSDEILDFKAPAKGLWASTLTDDPIQLDATPEAKNAILKDIQMVLYGLAHLYETGQAPTAIGKVALLWNRDKPVIQCVRVEMTREAARWIKAAAIQALDNVEQGRFAPNPLAWCGGCSSQFACKKTFGS